MFDDEFEFGMVMVVGIIICVGLLMIGYFTGVADERSKDTPEERIVSLEKELAELKLEVGE